jgi:hypothetical protein
MNAIELPGHATRPSPIQRQAAMRRFERLYSRVLMAVAAGLAIAMTAFICMTTHLLG